MLQWRHAQVPFRSGTFSPTNSGSNASLSSVVRRLIHLFTSHRSGKMPLCRNSAPTFTLRSHFASSFNTGDFFWPLSFGSFRHINPACPGERQNYCAKGENMKDFLTSVNRLQIWRRQVSLWGNIFVPPTLDRLAVLWLHQRGMLGVSEKLFLERFIQSGMIVADVGANQGIFTLLCARSVGSGTVFAFEPEPVLFDSLQGNVKRNRIENVKAFPKAAANTRSRA